MGGRIQFFLSSLVKPSGNPSLNRIDPSPRARGLFQKGFGLPAGQRDVNVQNILIFQNPVEGGYLVIDKHMEKKVGPVFRVPQTREAQQQILNGGSRVQLQNQVTVLVELGLKGRRVADGEGGIDFYPDGLIIFQFFHIQSIPHHGKGGGADDDGDLPKGVTASA
jgi:hypothetical protein